MNYNRKGTNEVKSKTMEPRKAAKERKSFRNKKAKQW